MKIEKITIYMASFPLKKPYELSFGSVDRFASIFVKAESGWKTGWGESTPLPGYSDDTANSAYKAATDISGAIIGKSTNDAMRCIDYRLKSGFSKSAPMLALEMLSGKIAWSGLNKKVPLVYLIASETPDTIKEEIACAYKNGYSVFKYKIGADVEKDSERAAAVLGSLPAGSTVRFDANQGYTFQEALEFIRNLNGNKRVEFVEQPLKVSAWQGTEKLSRLNDIPIMLDEAIQKKDDIIKTSRLGCARYIKLKLFKCGGFTKLTDMASFASRKGLKVIIGNGVSTGLGCLLEAKACAEVSGARPAGEMNGFLKMKTSILDTIKENEGNVDYKDIDMAGLVKEDSIEKYVVRKKEIYL